MAPVPPSVEACVVLGPLGSESGDVPEATGGVAASAALSQVVTLWQRCRVAARASRDCGVARTRRFVRFLHHAHELIAAVFPHHMHERLKQKREWLVPAKHRHQG